MRNGVDATGVVETWEQGGIDQGDGENNMRVSRLPIYGFYSFSEKTKILHLRKFIWVVRFWS